MPDYADPIARNALKALNARIERLERENARLRGRGQVILPKHSLGGHVFTPGDSGINGSESGPYAPETVKPHPLQGEMHVDLYDELWYTSGVANVSTTPHLLRRRPVRQQFASYATGFFSSVPSATNTKMQWDSGGNFTATTDGFSYHQDGDGVDWLAFPPGWGGLWMTWCSARQASGGGGFEPIFLVPIVEAWQDDAPLGSETTYHWDFATDNAYWATPPNPMKNTLADVYAGIRTAFSQPRRLVMWGNNFTSTDYPRNRLMLRWVCSHGGVNNANINISGGVVGVQLLTDQAAWPGFS